MKQFPHRFLLLSLTLISIYSISFGQKDFPVPPETYKRLFYVQRSSNTNTIIYDVNLLPGDIINKKKPIDAYWLMYAKGGRREELSYIQRKLAYGIDFRPTTSVNQYEFNIVSYPKRKLYLVKDLKLGFFALMDINGKPARLKNVFVSVAPRGAFSLSPDIEYVEIFGVDHKTGDPVYEKILID